MTTFLLSIHLKLETDLDEEVTNVVTNGDIRFYF
jgi:hypothetical protein